MLFTDVALFSFGRAFISPAASLHFTSPRSKHQYQSRHQRERSLEVLPHLDVNIHHVLFEAVLEAKTISSSCQWTVPCTVEPSESAYSVNMSKPASMQYIPALSKKTIIIKLEISEKIIFLLEVRAHYYLLCVHFLY